MKKKFRNRIISAFLAAAMGMAKSLLTVDTLDNFEED